MMLSLVEEAGATLSVTVRVPVGVAVMGGSIHHRAAISLVNIDRFCRIAELAKCNLVAVVRIFDYLTLTILRVGGKVRAGAALRHSIDDPGVPHDLSR
jgi:hypothetical protein